MDLSVSYMGLDLANPIILAASTVSASIDRIHQAEEVGAGALVARSLFAEQLDEEMAPVAHGKNPSPALMPRGIREHLLWLERVREKTNLPLIGSLNAGSKGSWIQRACDLENTGIDGLELNLYTVPADMDRSGQAIEEELLDIVAEVRNKVKVPIGVKLSPFFTSLPHFAANLDKTGVRSIILFNRFLQPTIDPESQSIVQDLTYSEASELRLPLRWTALLHGRINADIALTTGVQRGGDVASAILAGATAVEVASILYRHGIAFLATLRRELEIWMTDRGYDSPADFRGKLSQKSCDDPTSFERAQYRQLLLEQH